MDIFRKNEIEAETQSIINRPGNHPIEHHEFSSPTRLEKCDEDYIVIPINHDRFPTVPSFFETMTRGTLGELVGWDKIDPKIRKGASKIALVHRNAIPLVTECSGEWAKSQAISFGSGNEFLILSGHDPNKKMVIEEGDRLPLQSLWIFDHHINEKGHLVREHQDGRAVIFTQDVIYHAPRPEKETGFAGFWPGLVCCVSADCTSGYVDDVWLSIFGEEDPPCAISGHLRTKGGFIIDRNGKPLMARESA